MNLEFSVATENNIAAIVELVNSAYRGASSKAGWTTEADFLDGARTDADNIRQIISDPHTVVLICFNDARQLLACVHLQQQKNTMYLGMLTVRPHLQGAGIGRQVLDAAERYAAQHCCTTITLTVITLRSELIKWYERRGYQQTGGRKPFPTDPRFGIPKQPLEFLVMKKKIA